MPSLPSASWSGADSPWSSSAGPAPLHIIFPTRFSATRLADFAARAAAIAGTFSRGRRSPARWRRSAARRRRRGPLGGADVALAPARRPRPSARRAGRLRRRARRRRWRRSRRGRRSSPSRRRPAASMRRSACRSIRVGLAIADVSARLGAGGDKSLLAVEGALVNLRGKETAAPNLRIALARRRRARALRLDDAPAQGPARRRRARSVSSPASPRRRPASSTRWSNSSRRAIRIPSPRRDEGS